MDTSTQSEGVQRMALTTRDRVGVDLRGIGDAVRAAARVRHSTVAAFAREALVEALCRPSTLPEGIAVEFGRAEIVKLTLRLREPEAEALILNATGLGLSYGEYVARLVRQTPLPMPATERAADRAVLMTSSDNLAALSVDLAAFMRLLRMGKSAEVEKYRRRIESVDLDIRRHLDRVSALIAGA